MKLVSVQVGRPARRTDPDGTRWTTAFGKHVVEGPVSVRLEGLAGDGQADRRYHGGPDLAVLAYAAGHYGRFSEELSLPALGPGGLGENLTVEGVDEETACLGDVWKVGSARLQIASPRKPCSKISRFWQRPELLRLVEQSGRTGWALRVLEEGTLASGQPIELVDRPHPDWPIARVWSVARARRAQPALARSLAAMAALSPRWKEWLSGRPARV